MKSKLDNLFEKSKKLSQSVWVIIIALCYGIKNIYFYSNYLQEMPKLLKEFMNIETAISPIAIVLGIVCATVFMAFIIKTINNFIYNALAQRKYLNGDAKSFSPVFYVAYCLASLIVAVFTNLGFLSIEIWYIGNIIVSFIVYSFFYYLAFVYLNKTVIKPNFQAQAFKLISSAYLLYNTLFVFMDIFLYTQKIEIIINIVLVLVILGAGLISNKIKIKLVEAENIAREEFKAKLNSNKAEHPQNNEIFKGFGF